MSHEQTTTKSESEIVADRLAELLVSTPDEYQDSLFNTDRSLRERQDAQKRLRLRSENPDKLVIDDRLVDRYRYLAAVQGAGFHPSQIPDLPRGNLMWDEVRFRNAFSLLVGTTRHSSSAGAYITDEEDLRRIFQFDYENMQDNLILYDDILRERED